MPQAFLRLLHILAACASLFALSAQAHTAIAPPPLSAFFANPEFSGPQLSPDARHLAVKVSGANLSLIHI